MKQKIVALISLVLVFSLCSIAQTSINSNINILPSGQVLRIKMESDLSSKSAMENDTFSALLSEPVIIRGIEILPINTKFVGRVTKVKRAAKNGEAGTITILFETLSFAGNETRKIQSTLLSVSNNQLIENQAISGKSMRNRNAGLIIGGAGIGGILGAIFGKGSQTAIGAIAGVGVGAVGVVLNSGNEAIIKENSEMSIVLKEDVTLPVKDY